MMKSSKLINIAVVTLALILLITVVGYFAAPRISEPLSADSATVTNSSILTEIFGIQENAPNADSQVSVWQIVLRLILAVILSAILAFRPRKNLRLFERNLYVAQTQILLAVVAAALMMIVGDNAARAFAIFAAVSLVRFRTNIRDPKEVTVLLVCLALGLSAGIGRWELGAALCIFVLILLRLLEYKEPDQAVRPMELTVKTRNLDTTQAALQKIFEGYRLETEVRQINPPDEANPIGCIVHYLNLRLSLSTDYLSGKIIDLDRENIEGIGWEQKKSATDIYQ
ncbi:MAG TPA: DUF4956 domain-containing protein [Pyrinomonadaceae bacterium]|nr:DUF4956 domain-containing protein [Pyrinomonadaceae bacterium]